MDRRQPGQWRLWWWEWRRCCRGGRSPKRGKRRPRTNPIRRSSWRPSRPRAETRLGIVLGTRVLDIDGAQPGSRRPRPSCRRSRFRPTCARSSSSTPPSRRGSIRSPTTSRPIPRLASPFAFDVDKVSFKAPIKYPWNVLAAAANYQRPRRGHGRDRRRRQPRRRQPAAGATAGRAPAPRLEASTPRCCHRSIRIATRRSCSPSRRARASSTPASRSTSSDGTRAHRLGRRAGDHHRQAGRVPRAARVARTTTCSATASCSDVSDRGGGSGARRCRCSPARTGSTARASIAARRSGR